LVVTLSNGQPLPPFININDGEIKVSTNSPANVGNYALKFTGCYENKVASFYQGVEVRFNTPPIVLNMTANSSVQYNFTVGGIWQILIPQIYDSEQNSEYLLSVSTSQDPKKFGKLPYFMQFDGSQQSINLSP